MRVYRLEAHRRQRRAADSFYVDNERWGFVMNLEVLSSSFALSIAFFIDVDDLYKTNNFEGLFHSFHERLISLDNQIMEPPILIAFSSNCFFDLRDFGFGHLLDGDLFFLKL